MFFKRGFCILILLLTLPKPTAAQTYRLYVGESHYISTPNAPYNGWIENANWTVNGENLYVSESSAAGAIIYPKHYFEGTESITCNYTYGYYSGTHLRAGYSQATFYISCNPVYATLSDKTLELKVGSQKRLTYTLSETGYSSYTEKNIKIIDVATVDKRGNVTAVGTGSTYIYLDPIGGPEVYCQVTVKPNPPTDIKLSSNDITITEGNSCTLSCTFSPQGASSDITWSSSNINVATVSNSGSVKAIKEGDAVITAKTENGLTATCVVHVTPLPKSISLPQNEKITISYGKTLVPQLTPSNSSSTYTWKSSDSSIAMIDAAGVIRGVRKGRATITVTTANKLSATCEVEVVDAPEGMDYRNAQIRLKGIQELVKRIKK